MGQVCSAKRGMRLTLAMLLASVSGTALAQDASRAGVEEITVTAQKREEKLNRVPISITALSEQRLEQIGAKDLEGFAREVPGLSVQPATNGGGSSIVIRGISSTAGDATVGVYIDDIPIQTVKSSFAPDPTPKLFDIQRVEVLRGPQGTLYGASSEGGTVRFITPTPSLTEFSGKIRSELAFTEHGDPSFETGAAFGGPLVQDKVGMRASVFFRRDGGYVDRVSRSGGNAVIDADQNQLDTVAARVALNLAASDRLQILPSVYFQRLRSNGLPLTWSTLPGLQQADTVNTPGTDRMVLPSLTINYDFDALRVTSVTSYFNRRNFQQFDYSLITQDTLTAGLYPLTGLTRLPGFDNYQSRSRNTTTQQNVTQELRLASAPDSGRLSYTVGVFYQHARNRVGQEVAEPGFASIVPALTGGFPLEALSNGVSLLPGGLSYQQSSWSTIDQTALFGEVGYEVTDKLKVTAGLRVSRVEVESQFNADGIYNRGPTPPELRGVQSTSETPVNPKVTVSYQLDDDKLVYATASRGFRVGGPNTPIPTSLCGADLAAQGTTAAQLRSFNSDNVWNYEVGAKTKLLDNRLTVNGSAFYIDWSNIQQAIGLKCGFGYVANLGSATSRGFDLEVQYRLFPGFTLGAAVGYTRATLNDNIYGSRAPDTGIVPLIARAGDYTLLSPTWTYNLVATYEHEVATGFDGYVRADLQHAGSFRRTMSVGTTTYDPDTYRGPSYNFVTLRTGIVHGGLNLAVFADNLFDAHPVLFKSYGLSANTRAVAQQATIRPRTVGVTASYQF